MGDFVQMSLERYDSLKVSNDSLKRQQIAQQETYSNYVAQTQKEINYLKEKIEQYKQYILGRNCTLLNVNDYSLEYYLNINSWNYAINYKDDLLKLGFTKQEMDEFISNEYKKAVKEKELQ
jgi:hypothetical protein